MSKMIVRWESSGVRVTEFDDFYVVLAVMPKDRAKPANSVIDTRKPVPAFMEGGSYTHGFDPNEDC